MIRILGKSTVLVRRPDEQ
jgi:hypothetical protein